MPRNSESPSSRSAKGTGFTRFDEISECLERVLETSVADETEVAWFERRHGEARSDGAPAKVEDPRLSVIVRVVESGRLGWYRTDTPDSHLLESGVRQAMALAKGQDKLKRTNVLATDDEEFRAPRRLFDRDVSRLDPHQAAERLNSLVDDGESARMSWTDVRLVIYNSHGLKRSAASTDVTCEMRSGDGPGMGFAAASSRRLEDLDLEAILDRARAGRGTGPAAEIPQGSVPVLLSPEATAAWLNLLNAHAFSGSSFIEGTSFLRRHRNIQVFDRRFNLRDDATTHLLSFPFDFEGVMKRPLELIVEGRPTTPALSQSQGIQAGLEPTGQAVGGEDALFSHLFLLPGEASDEDLLAAADGGIRIAWLDGSECYEPSKLLVRARARGVRRIENGRLGAPLPDLTWETSLLGSLARLRAIGMRPTVLAAPTTPLGGIAAPSVVLEEASGLCALR